MIIFLGFLFSVIFLLFVGFINGQPSWFVDSASPAFVLYPPIFFLWVTKGGKAIKGYIKSSFKRSYQYSATELNDIASASKGAVKVTLAAGCFGFLGGIIGAMRFAGPEYLASNLALAFISLLYSIAIAFFCFFPLQAWAENKAAQIERNN